MRSHLCSSTGIFLLTIRRFSIDIGTEGTKSLWKGIAQTICDIVDNVSQDMLDELYSAYADCAREVINALVHGKDKSGLYGLKRVDPSFLGDTLKIFTAYKPQISSVSTL